MNYQINIWVSQRLVIGVAFIALAVLMLGFDLYFYEECDEIRIACSSLAILSLPVPLEDGTTHINIYTRGQTTLGRWLSNLANVKVTIDNITFRSLENYWFWLQANEEAKPFLVSCLPFEAKNYFKNHPEHRIPKDPMFEEKIKHAMRRKLHQHPGMAKMFAESTLPFTHYYQYGGKPVPAGHDWIVEYWEETRSNPRFQRWVNSYQ